MENVIRISLLACINLQPMAELRRTQMNVVKSKGILKAPSAAAIRQLTTDHSLGLGIDFTEGGKPLKHGRDQLQQLYSHEFQVCSKAG